MRTTSHKETFVQLIHENRGIIFKICISYCANKIDRDDLAQEIVYNLWKSYQNFNAAFKFSTWMYRIALNVAISFYRKENKPGDYIPFSEDLIMFEESQDAAADSRQHLIEAYA